MTRTYVGAALDEQARRARHVVRVVFDMEVTPPMPLGVYLRMDEDAVVYQAPSCTTKRAPEDCVRVVAVDLGR